MKQFEGSLNDFQNLLKNKPAVLVYCSTNECNVCVVLKPKVEEMLLLEFPQIETVYLQLNEYPEIAGQLRIFAAPTILAFFGGHEYLRKSRAFGIDDLKRELVRPYLLMFS